MSKRQQSFDTPQSKKPRDDAPATPERIIPIIIPPNAPVRVRLLERIIPIAIPSDLTRISSVDSNVSEEVEDNDHLPCSFFRSPDKKRLCRKHSYESFYRDDDNPQTPNSDEDACEYNCDRIDDSSENSPKQSEDD